MKIKAILMDISGVILKAADEDDFQPILAKFANAIGVDPAIVFAVRKEHIVESLLGEFSNDDFFKEVEKKAAHRLPLDVLDIWTQTALSEYTVNKPLIAWVESIRPRCKVVAFTDISALRHPIDEALKIYEHFDATFLSLQLGLTKANPEFFNYALRTLHVTPGETLLVDDQEINIERAQSLGLAAVQYKKPYFDHPEEFLKAISIYEI